MNETLIRIYMNLLERIKELFKSSVEKVLDSKKQELENLQELVNTIAIEQTTGFTLLHLVRLKSHMQQLGIEVKALREAIRTAPKLISIFKKERKPLCIFLEEPIHYRYEFILALTSILNNKGLIWTYQTEYKGPEFTHTLGFVSSPQYPISLDNLKKVYIYTLFDRVEIKHYP
jgi:hypothetical protein